MYRINFLWKENESQISGFAVAKKAASPWKKFSSLFVQIWSSKRCVEYFLKNKWASRYLSFGDLKVPKITFHNRTRSTKNHEHSAHRFEENYLTNHLVKFLQDRVKPLKSWSFYSMHWLSLFLKKIVSKGFLTSFNFLRGSC